MCGSGAVSCSCSLLIRGPILPAGRQKLHLSPCADSRNRLYDLTAAKVNDKVQELIYMLDLIDPVFATSVLTTALVHFLETQKRFPLCQGVLWRATSPVDKLDLRGVRLSCPREA